MYLVAGTRRTMRPRHRGDVAAWIRIFMSHTMNAYTLKICKSEDTSVKDRLCLSDSPFKETISIWHGAQDIQNTVFDIIEFDQGSGFTEEQIRQILGLLLQPLNYLSISGDKLKRGCAEYYWIRCALDAGKIQPPGFDFVTQDVKVYALSDSDADIYKDVVNLIWPGNPGIDIRTAAEKDLKKLRETSSDAAAWDTERLRWRQLLNTITHWLLMIDTLPHDVERHSCFARELLNNQVIDGGIVRLMHTYRNLLNQLAYYNLKGNDQVILEANKLQYLLEVAKTSENHTSTGS